jgi:hypothetical protein
MVGVCGPQPDDGAVFVIKTFAPLPLYQLAKVFNASSSSNSNILTLAMLMSKLLGS